MVGVARTRGPVSSQMTPSEYADRVRFAQPRTRRRVPYQMPGCMPGTETFTEATLDWTVLISSRASGKYWKYSQPKGMQLV